MIKDDDQALVEPCKRSDRQRDRPIDEALDRPELAGATPERRLQDGQVSDRVQEALLGMKSDDRVVLTLRHNVLPPCALMHVALDAVSSPEPSSEILPLHANFSGGSAYLNQSTGKRDSMSAPRT